MLSVQIRELQPRNDFKDAKADIAANVALPQGYQIEWGGQFENQQRASARLMVVLPISIVLIFASYLLTEAAGVI